MKQRLVVFVCGVLRLYFRVWPWRVGKLWVWDHVVRPYILWRQIPLVAVTEAGNCFEGALPDVLHSYLYFFGVWEPSVVRMYRLHLRPGDICIDIGANVGAHALLANSIVAASGRVHAIEASPSIFRRLRRNCELSRASTLTLYNVAVTDVPADVTVFVHDAGNPGATTILDYEANRRAIATTETIAGRPLGEIVPIDQILASRLIKIDVEGAEWMVLQGMAPLLPRLNDDCLILLELTAHTLERQGETVASVMAWMAGFGFQAFEVRNSYHPDAYISPIHPATTASIAPDAPLLDIAFAKPALRDALLAADAARGAR